MKIKKGDHVVVITGKDKGKEGEVIRSIPTANKVIVSGVNIAKKHTKPRSQNQANGINVASKHQKARRANEQGGIIHKDLPLHASNVMLVHKGKKVRVGYKTQDDGTKVRVARPSGEVIK